MRKALGGGFEIGKDGNSESCGFSAFDEDFW